MYDVEGLYLLVNPSRRKYWRMKYRFLQQERTLSFGVYPSISLWEARNKCFEAKTLLKQKIDPNEKKERDTQETQLKNVNTFEVVVNNWAEVRCHPKKAISALKRDLFEPLGQKPIAGITAFELFEALKKAEACRVGRAYRTLKFCHI
jgi:hypothetical protein